MIFQKTKSKTPQKPTPPRRTTPSPRELANIRLLQAAVLGDVELIHMALDQGADVDARDGQGRTPLMRVFVGDESDNPLNERAMRAAAERLASQLDSNAKSKVAPEVLALLKAGAQVNVTDKKGMTPLLYAALLGDFTASQELLQRKANLHYETKEGVSALGIAVFNNDLALTDLFLKAGASVKLKKASLLTVALERLDNQEKKAEEENIGTLAGQLFSAFTGIRQQTPEVETIIERLLQAGADPNQLIPDTLPPLHMAAKSGSPRLIRILVARGARLDLSQENSGITALHVAAFAGRADTARALLEVGADPNAISKEGSTALQLAAKAASYALVELLLKAGARQDPRNTLGKSARDIAVGNRHSAIVELLDRFKP